MMNKSTFGAALAFLAVAGGALAAGAIYLRRREKELDEYERLLFDDLEEFDDEEEEDTIYEPIVDDIPAEEPAAADEEGTDSL